MTVEETSEKAWREWLLLWVLEETHAQVEATGSIERAAERRINAYGCRWAVPASVEKPGKERIRTWVRLLQGDGMLERPKVTSTVAVHSRHVEGPLKDLVLCPVVLTRKGFLYASDLKGLLQDTSAANRMRVEIREAIARPAGWARRAMRHPVLSFVAVGAMCAVTALLLAAVMP